MATLAGRKPSATYKGLLNIDNSNTGIDSTLRTVQDGEGTEGTLQLSSTGLNVTSGLQYNSNAISIAGALTFSGAYAFTGTLTGATTITFPTSGTLLNIAPGANGKVLVSNGSEWVVDDLPALSNSCILMTIIPQISGFLANTDYYAPVGIISASSLYTSANFSSAFGQGIRIPADGTLSDLNIRASIGINPSITFTLQVNGVDTALTYTFSTGGPLGTDSTHSVAVTAGDYIRYRINEAGTPSLNASISVKFTF